MMYIAVDPGLKGAICMIDTDRGIKEIHPMPAGKGYPEPLLVVNKLKQIINNNKFCAAVERTSVRPGQGVSATHSYGYGAGVLAGALFALNPVGIHFPAPQTWQKFLWSTYNSRGDDTKQKTYQAVLCAHPDLAPFMTTIDGKLLDGNSDSVGICAWLINQHGVR